MAIGAAGVAEQRASSGNRFRIVAHTGRCLKSEQIGIHVNELFVVYAHAERKSFSSRQRRIGGRLRFNVGESAYAGFGEHLEIIIDNLLPRGISPEQL